MPTHSSIPVPSNSLIDLIRDRVGVCETCHGMTDHVKAPLEPCTACGGRVLNVGDAMRAGILVIAEKSAAGHLTDASNCFTM